MTTAYIPSAKDVNTLRRERACEHCEGVYIKVTNDNRLIAYPPGRMGQMERGWELGAVEETE